MPKDLIVCNSNSKHDSVVCREWLNYLNNENIEREAPIHAYNINDKIDIHNGKVGKKKEQYYKLKRPFTVDSYDKTIKTVYQFYGCYWHGCRKCHLLMKLNIIRLWNNETCL